ncbi:MAG: hypothetical protein OCD03_09460 [Hyphomicrobiales bacterium]
MKNFKYIDDVESWVEPMDYQGFWYAVQPYNLVLQPRDHCDEQISTGVIDEATVLDVLKMFVSLELTERHGLRRREVTPWLKLVE